MKGEETLAFTKMSGGGNDFLVLDAAAVAGIPDLAGWLRRVCRRRLSVGADGVLLIGPSESADLRLVHHNADGGRSALCGNGTRCAARWARRRAGGEGPVRVETDAGIVTATFPGEGRVALALGLRSAAPEPREVRLEDGTVVRGHFLEVGIPHYVERVEAADRTPVETRGRPLRWHAAFGAAGANVSFVAPRADGGLDIRTYERGVEAETLSCGTGCVAAAVVAVHAGWCRPPVRCRTRSGIDLVVGLEADGDGYGGLILEGDARIIYEGILVPEGAAWGGDGRPA